MVDAQDENKKTPQAVAGQNAPGMEGQANTPVDTNLIDSILQGAKNEDQERQEKIDKIIKIEKIAEISDINTANRLDIAEKLSAAKQAEALADLKAGQQTLQLNEDTGKAQAEAEKQRKAATEAQKQAQEEAARAEKKRQEEEDKKRAAAAAAQRKKIIKENARKAFKKEIIGVSVNPLDIVQASIPAYGTFHKGKLLWQGIKSIFS